MFLEWGYTKSGSGHGTNLGDAPTGEHDLKITYFGGTARVYLDDVEKGSISITLSNPDFHILAAGKANGDKVNATWDNATSGYYSPGTLTSSIYDTGSSPPTLTFVDWNDTTSSKSSVKLEVRSSDNADMSSPTSWTQVSKSQTSGLPTAKRYLQYRATLTSTDGTETPSFLNATINYYMGISKVELSIDNMATWTTATGTSSWRKTLNLPEGDRTIWVKATDVTGLTNVTSIKVTVDTTPPLGSVLIEDGEPFTSTPLVNLTINATDRFGVPQMMISDASDFASAAWVNYTEYLDWTLGGADGTKTIYAKFKDGNGLVSNVFSDTIVLDTQPPVGSLIINNGATYTNDSRLVLGLHATDTSLVSDMSVSLSPTFAGATWDAYQDTAELVLTPGEGERTVYARFRDVLGHISSTVNDTIILDTRPPTVTLLINNGSMFTGTPIVSVQLSAVDATPVEYMQLGEGSDISGIPFESFRTNLTFILSNGDGKKTLNARVIDAAGNIGPIGAASIVLDTTPPFVEVVIEAGEAYTRTRLVTVVLSVTDEGVVQLMRLGEDPDLSTVPDEPFKAITSVVLSDGDGPKTLYARVTDAAGNVGPTGSGSIILDTIAPVMGIVINGGAAFTSMPDVSVRLTIVERYAAEYIELSEDPSFSGTEHMPFKATVAWSLSSGDGEKVLYVRATDLAGNVGQVAYTSIILDTTPPVLDLSINGFAGYTGSRTIALGLTQLEQNPTGDIEIDDLPTFATAETVQFKATFPWELSVGDGAKTLYVRTTDRAGNIGQVASATIVLDMTAPVVTMRLNGGATLTNGTTVSVELTVTDANPSGQAELDEDPTFVTAMRGPSGGPLTFILSDGDGAKVIHVRVRDLAGNANAPVSVPIVLDTTPPTLSVQLDGGARFTLDRDVTAGLDASDANGVVEMVVAEGPITTGATPRPFEGSIVVVLSQGDGVKTVIVAVRDDAGNWCVPVTATITLDTTPPKTTLLADHESSESVEVAVSWTAVELTSGVVSYDVQYRDGEGPWANLTLGTNATSTVFTGRRAHTYYFRARATDAAGNVEQFPEDPLELVRVEIVEPVRFLEQPLTIVVIVILVIASAVGGGYHLYRKRGNRRERLS